MSTDDLRELIGPFVLGACSEEEAAQVRAHMVASPAFRAEVESFDVVHGALLDVPAVDVAPDRALKRSIMERVQAEASLFQAAGPAERAAIARDHAGDPAATGPSPARGEGLPAPSPRRSAFLEALRHPARAAALAAVLVALVVGGIVLGGGGPDTREVTGQVTALAGPDATVRMTVRDGDSRLRLSGFSPAGAGRRYQVWLKSGDAPPRPTKVLFDVDANGNATAVIPDDVDAVDDVLVTSEPASGSSTPTTKPVLHVQI